MKMAGVNDIPTFIADEDLKDDPHPRARYLNFAMALRRNPGLWAEYPGKVKSAASTAARLNSDSWGSLPCTDFEAKVSEGKCYVRFHPQELREGYQRRARREEQIPPPPVPQRSTDTWATLLFERLGPERADMTYRLLSKLLHPDMPLGDKTLMQELNAARNSL